MRELATKIAPIIAGIAQLHDRKIQMLDKNDADCFQRLAKGEGSALGVNDGATSTEVGAVLNIGFDLRAQTMLGFQPSLIASENADIGASYTNRDLPDSSVGSALVTPKHMGSDVQHTCDNFHSKKSGPGQKFTAHSHLNLDAENPNISSKFELVPHQTITVKQADVMPSVAGSLVLPLVAQVQTATMRITELPHVTRVHIEQTKRNAAGVLTSLELALEPAKLGRISAKIQHDEGRITLVISAEHSAVADDLARDSGLLMKVLGDQIPGLNKMLVFVQTEAQMSQALPAKSFADLYSNNRQQEPRRDKPAEFEFVPSHKPTEVPTVNHNATGLHVRI